MTDSPGVIGQIARVEGRRLLASPFLWLATVASGALALFFFEGEPATLDFRSAMIAGSCLPLAAVTLLLTHHAASRDRASSIGELVESPPTGPDLRMLGLAAAGWAPLLLSLLVVIFGVVLALSDGPAGSWNLAELAVGPLVVILGHSTGVALGRWLPHPLVAPLALVVIAGTYLTYLIGVLALGETVVPATSRYLPWRDPYTDWVQGEARSPIAHLLYLAGLIAVAATFAARRWRALVIGSLLLVTAVVLLSDVEVDGEEVVAAVDDWGEAQPRFCQDHGGVRFCAIEGYETWIDGWSSTVGRVDDLVPVTLGVREVQQTTGSAFFDVDPAVAHVHGRWEGGTSSAARGLTMQVLAPELGLPGTAGEAAEMNTGVPECMAMTMPLLVSGQARAVGLIVLSDLAVPRTVLIDEYPGPVRFEQLELSRDEVDLAQQIMDRPRQEIVSTLQDNWDELVDPATSTATLAGWFGLEAPEVITESSFEAMTCTCTGDGGVQCTGGRP